MAHGRPPSHEGIDPNLWGGVTNPAEHDPSHFRYLVHGISPGSKVFATYAAALMSDGPTDMESGDQSVNLYQEPERLAERISLSMSLIDQDHTATWGDAGLIVEAPEQNVLMTSEEDAGAHNSNVESLLWQASQSQVMTGDTLLAHTNPYIYNEVTTLANRDGSTVRLAGFFYTMTRNGQPVDQTVARQMQMHATRLGLPVVAIRKPNPNSVDGVKTTGDTLAVDLEGQHYMLDGHDDYWQFRIGDETGAYHFASPQEITVALDYAVQSGGLSEERAAEIAAKYEAARTKRETPAAHFDDDGTFKEISYHQNYGRNELRIYLTQSGHGYRVNTNAQIAAYNESMLDSGSSSSSFYTPLSPWEADRMVERACAGLDEAQASGVRQWYTEHRAVTAQDWEYHLQSQRHMYRDLR